MVNFTDPEAQNRTFSSRIACLYSARTHRIPPHSTAILILFIFMFRTPLPSVKIRFAAFLFSPFLSSRFFLRFPARFPRMYGVYVTRNAYRRNFAFDKAGPFGQHAYSEIAPFRDYGPFSKQKLHSFAIDCAYTDKTFHIQRLAAVIYNLIPERLAYIALYAFQCFQNKTHIQKLRPQFAHYILCPAPCTYSAAPRKKPFDTLFWKNSVISPPFCPH
jgi:hypothetical protein